MSFPFNVRVYGALVHEGHILLSNERHQGMSFTKLPGGGLEFGEGLRDALRREFMEELGLEIKVGAHIYTTDFFQVSAFNPKHQVISVYYQLHLLALPNGLPEYQTLENSQTFEWVALSELSEAHLTFPIEKSLVPRLKQLV